MCVGRARFPHQGFNRAANQHFICHNVHAYTYTAKTTEAPIHLRCDIHAVS